MLATKSFVYKPWFWAGATTISALCCAYAYFLFPKAIPIVAIDLKMNRTQALNHAQELATKYEWSPRKYDQAVLFVSDEETKNFIELEGGGKDNVTTVINENELALYSWNVRHFKEGNPRETLIMFKTDGSPFGFEEKLTEDDTGAALEQRTARTLAEEYARTQWNISFENYTIVEHGQETARSGRIDHTLTYERTDKKIGIAPHRLIIKISGDKVTKIKPFLYVPEGFKRRYQHMRSFNESLSMLAYFLEMILYLIFGGLVALFFLVRMNWVLFKPSAIWALIVAGGYFINTFNQLPLAWYQYPTELAQSTFILKYVLAAFMLFLQMFGKIFITFAAAEGLTRLAFQDHIQFWKVWNTNVASTWNILGRTIGGYLLVGIKLAFVVSFYAFSLAWLGWWTPTGALINPNVLSAYLPWFSSLAISLMAGFREECFFRAIPLAGGKLLGKRFGNQRAWLVAAFIVQAIIFGAAHANYPAQPFYARLVELTFSSTLFGIVYLLYGLLPVVITHYAYDVFWFALPLFVSEAHGVWFSRLLVLLGTFIPLFVVIGAYLKTKLWTEVGPQWYNWAWQPQQAITTQLPTTIRTGVTEPGRLVRFGLYLLALISLGAFYVLHTPNKTFTSLTVSRTQALAETEKHMRAHHALANYQTLGEVKNPLQEAPKPRTFKIKATEERVSSEQDQHWFVWRTGGKETYKQLMGKYLQSPYWHMRYVTFAGDIAQRAHEYQRYIVADGSVIREKEKLPEQEIGVTLNEQQAREKAQRVLEKQYQISLQNVTERAATPAKKPNRTDWTFVFVDTTQQLADGGQARITVKLAGDKVVDQYRWIHVPEEHERSHEQERSLLLLISALCSLLAMLTLSCGAGLGIFSWAFGKFNTKVAGIIVGVLSAKTIVQLVNLGPSFTTGFQTSQPYGNQLLMLTLAVGWGSLVKILPVALLGGFVYALLAPNRQPPDEKKYSIWLFKTMLTGSSVGVITWCATVLSKKLVPLTNPVWPPFVHASAFLPSVSFELASLTTFISITLILMLIWCMLTCMRTTLLVTVANILFFIGVGCTLIGISPIVSIEQWLVQGIALGLCMAFLYQLIVRHEVRLVPPAVATFFMLSAGNALIFNPWPSTWYISEHIHITIAVASLLMVLYCVDKNK